MQLLTYLWLMLMPLHSVAEVIVIRDPLAYPLKQWAFVLGMALAGGLASWWAKVRKGEVAYHNLQSLIGELTVSAFVGVVTFFGCEWLRLDPLLTAAIVGISGHMGTRGMVLLERIAERRLRRTLGDSTDRAPLGKD